MRLMSHFCLASSLCVYSSASFLIILSFFKFTGSVSGALNFLFRSNVIENMIQGLTLRITQNMLILVHSYKSYAFKIAKLYYTETEILWRGNLPSKNLPYKSRNETIRSEKPYQNGKSVCKCVSVCVCFK